MTGYSHPEKERGFACLATMVFNTPTEFEAICWLQFMAKLEMGSVQAEISAKDYITYKKCWVRNWFLSASKMAENKNTELTSCVFLYL